MTTRWSPFFKQLIVIAGLIAVVWVIFRVQVILAPLILAILFTYIISYPVNWVEKRTYWPRTFIVLLVLLIAILMLAIASVILVPNIVNLIRSFGGTLTKAVQDLLNVTPRPIVVTPTLVIDLGPFYRPVNQWLQGIVQPDLTAIENLQRLVYPFATGAASVVIGAVSSFIWMVFIFILIFFLVRDGPRLRAGMIHALPEVWRPEISRLLNELAYVWNLFLRGQIVLSIAVGFIVWMLTTILGVRNAPALGLLAVVMEFIPGVGPAVTAITAVVLALLFGSTWMPVPNLAFAIIVAVSFIILGQFDNTYLLPRIVGRRVALHPAVVIVGAAAGAQLAGVLGILLAAPTIASLRVINTYVFRKLFDQEPFPEPEASEDPRTVWEELTRERSTRAVLFDLDGTLIETDEMIITRIVSFTDFLEPVISSEHRTRIARKLLMSNEGLANGLVTVLDIMHLDGLVFKANDLLRRMQGIRSPGCFVPVEGSLEALRALRQQNLMLGVVTTRSREDVAAFLGQQELGELFHAVVTRDDVRRLKPHPMSVLLAAERLGLPPEQCVMVGDTHPDISAGRAAGALTIGVLCGFGSDRDLRAADLILGSPAELRAWL